MTDDFTSWLSDALGKASGVAEPAITTDTASVLRQVAASRKMLELHTDGHECRFVNPESGMIDEMMWECSDGVVCLTLVALAEMWRWTGE